MNRYMFVTLSEAIEKIEESNHSHNQDVVLLPPTNDSYASDVEVWDDNIVLAGNLDLLAEVTGQFELSK